MKIILTSDRKEMADTLKDGAPAAALQLRAMYASSPLSADQAERTIEFVLSDETRDHAGDIMRQSGWSFERFMANPVMPWGHDYDHPPIGRWENVRVEKLPRGPALVGVARFATPETYSFADTIFRLAISGMLKGVSVGFDPKKWNRIQDEKGGYEFLEQSLLEASICTLPCNPNTLARSVQEKVISKRELDELITRHVHAALDQGDLAPNGDVFKQLLSRVERLDVDVQTIKAIIESPEDPDGQPASSHAAASPELARCRDLIREIKAAIKRP